MHILGNGKHKQFDIPLMKWSFDIVMTFSVRTVHSPSCPGVRWSGGHKETCYFTIANHYIALLKSIYLPPAQFLACEQPTQLWAAYLKGNISYS